jgi:hypothetical protein
MTINVALVDGLLDFLVPRRFVTQEQVVLVAATLARTLFYAAEGFVNDLVAWPPEGPETAIPVGPLVDALLDLRCDLTAGV